MLADDVVFEYVITVPGYPRRIEGRQAVADLYRSYGASIVLHRCHDPIAVFTALGWPQANLGAV